MNSPFRWSATADPRPLLAVADASDALLWLSIGEAGAPAPEPDEMMGWAAQRLGTCPIRDDAGLRPLLDRIAAALDGGEMPTLTPPGTDFQRAVWQALRAIPRGETRSYGAIAKSLGRPGAARAVGAACKANPIARLIPCHRAVGHNGGLVGFTAPGGVATKRRLLADEAAHSAP